MGGEEDGGDGSGSGGVVDCRGRPRFCRGFAGEWSNGMGMGRGNGVGKSLLDLMDGTKYTEGSLLLRELLLSVLNNLEEAYT